MTEITLYNTRTRRKEALTPVVPGKVGMYVCGPTVYDRAHIGNARAVVVFDTLFRLLRHSYGAENVTYVRNFTDVDDKINARAAATLGPGETELEAIRRITDETIGWYHADMDALGALRPTLEPRATEFIGPMIAMIEELIAKGHAYAAEGHVLFSVASDPDYGKLARRDLEEMRAGARVEVAPYKRDPMDFVLWKPSDAVTPGWPSPWGRGRPGWHIECSAMAYELLGKSFDIHGGGIDLAFPHHENELAQSRCAHPEGDFAHIWMHNGMLNVEGDKMSKSLGNFFTVREILERYEDEFAIENVGPAIRLRLLQTHYREPINWSRETFEAAITKLGLWNFYLGSYSEEKVDLDERLRLLDGTDFLTALCDDLNTPRAVVEIDAMIKRAQPSLPAQNVVTAPDSTAAFDSAQYENSRVRAAIELLGFDLGSLRALRHDHWSERLKQRALASNEGVATLVAELLETRANARRSRDFARADELRDGFAAAGVIVKDTAAGAEWELSPSFDPAKLEALR